MNEELKVIVEKLRNAGFNLYKSFVDDDTILILGPRNKAIYISREQLAKCDVNGIDLRTQLIFDGMKDGYSFSKTNI